MEVLILKQRHRQVVRKIDYIIIFCLSVFLGIFLISQYYADKEYDKVVQPENNEILAVEVARLTKSNSDLRTEVKELTNTLDNYRKSNSSRTDIFNQYSTDNNRLDLINGVASYTGQGILLQANGKLTLPEIVDLVNAFKNIGGEVIAINDKRLIINSNLNQFVDQSSLSVKIIGNSQLLKSALERKGGIIEQLSNKEIKFTIEEKEVLDIPSGELLKIRYGKIVSD